MDDPLWKKKISETLCDRKGHDNINYSASQKNFHTCSAFDSQVYEENVVYTDLQSKAQLAKRYQIQDVDGNHIAPVIAVSLYIMISSRVMSSGKYHWTRLFLGEIE